MKYILTDSNNGILGLFTTAEKVDNGYLCDGESYQTSVTGEVTLSEVADDYKIPQVDSAPVIEKPTLEDLQAQIDALKGAV